ncbi:hypothetical protein [Streptomyces botrytidirepellens]|uniref:hypothetical protein n=1 Tax=Streptomyces botrytidirepellens TaxID=2486417 RepID=UPI0011CE9E6A|nr:hypothetical protein [Streptomyces botrytidirepellens]
MNNPPDPHAESDPAAEGEAPIYEALLHELGDVVTDTRQTAEAVQQQAAESLAFTTPDAKERPAPGAAQPPPED